MLKITADVRSGLENPSWILTDEAEIRALNAQLANTPTALADTGIDPEGRLGFRGIHIAPYEDDVRNGDATAAGYVSTATVTGDANLAVIERVAALIDRPDSFLVDTDPEGLPELAGVALLEQLAALDGLRITETDPAGADQDMEETIRAAASCGIELGTFNPGFWNNDPAVRTRNNCYNYASNKRTDTFAQPGRGVGRMYGAITCPEVTRASLDDGLHRRFDCFPPAEAPRYLVALVVAPGPGFRDFHWYRYQKGGFWGHKPGGTAARNTDNSGRLITNPQLCDRGPYSQFCGYFYTCRSQRIR